MRRRTGEAGTRLRFAALLREAISGLVSKPSRSALTISGAALAIATFVAVLNLTATAAGQVSDVFLTAQSRLARVTDAAARANPDARHLSFPADSLSRVEALNGVRAAGLQWPVITDRGRGATVTTEHDPTDLNANVRAVSPSMGAVLGVQLRGGRFIDELDERSHTPAVVLGEALARRMGITQLVPSPSVLVGGQPMVVVGILASAENDADAVNTLFLSTATAKELFGLPQGLSPAELVALTDQGAVQQVGAEIPLALDPADPEQFQTAPVVSGSTAQPAIDQALLTLLLILASTTLVVAVVSITNLSTVSVFERRFEIGLRRSMGAQRRHIVGQILLENAILGAMGGLLGTALGNLVVLVVALAVGWTALISPWPTLLAPLAGLFLGALAGIHPSLQAARIEPADALRA